MRAFKITSCIEIITFTISEEDDQPRPVRTAPLRPPGPPLTPAPDTQPRYRPSVKVHRKKSNPGQEIAQPEIGKLQKQKDEKIYFRQQGLSQVPQLTTNLNFLQTPAGGQAKASRLSHAGEF